MPRQAQLAVLFADISGSVRLYDLLGDVRARTIVSRCISVMTEAMQRHGGTLVKTIGDEVMTIFPGATEAAEAACEMQEGITGQMVVDGSPLSIRVGFHFGSLLLENADVFGDAVNVAARIAHHAKSGEILTTGPTVEQLEGARRRSCRQIDLTQVRGKREDVAIFEVLRQPEDATDMRLPWTPKHRSGGRLVLTLGGTRMELGEGNPPLTMGRSDRTDLVVQHPMVSRLHARIEARNGRFVLTDVSANGTYIVPDGGGDSYVLRDSHVLDGSGMLGLGEAVSPNLGVAVRYETA